MTRRAAGGEDNATVAAARRGMTPAVRARGWVTGPAGRLRSRRAATISPAIATATMAIKAIAHAGSPEPSALRGMRGMRLVPGRSPDGTASGLGAGKDTGISAVPDKRMVAVFSSPPAAR